MLIWAAVDTYLAAHKIRLLHREKAIIPATPVESALLKARRTEQRSSQQTIQQLTQHQQEQFDRLELYSHEIKNSLTGLQAAAENHQQVPSNSVLTAVRQANYQLNLLLSDERLAMPDNDFAFEWVDLAKLVTAILKENSAVFINRQLVPQLAGLAGVSVLTDRKWLRFCLVQLLSNAIKYSPPGATITIQWADHALAIIDQGCGISSTDLPRIFDNGFSGRNGHLTTKSTGMGLYLVKKVTAQLNFSLTVASQLHKGTTASLHFAAANTRQPSPAP